MFRGCQRKFRLRFAHEKSEVSFSRNEESALRDTKKRGGLCCGWPILPETALLAPTGLKVLALAGGGHAAPGGGRYKISGVPSSSVQEPGQIVYLGVGWGGRQLIADACV